MPYRVPRHVVSLVVLWSCVATTAQAATLCYAKASNNINQISAGPCGSPTNDESFVACCNSGDICLSGGLCHALVPPTTTSTSAGASFTPFWNDWWGDGSNPGSLTTGYYIGGCTDPSVTSSAPCNIGCADQESSFLIFNTTIQQWRCCGANEAACSNPTGEGFVGIAPRHLNATFQVAAVSSVSSSSAVATSSTAVSATITPQILSVNPGNPVSTTGAPGPTAASTNGTTSDPVKDTTSNGHSVGRDIGIAVGVLIPTLALAGLGIYLYISRRRRAQWEAENGVLIENQRQQELRKPSDDEGPPPRDIKEKDETRDMLNLPVEPIPVTPSTAPAEPKRDPQPDLIPAGADQLTPGLERPIPDGLETEIPPSTPPAPRPPAGRHGSAPGLLAEMDATPYVVEMYSGGVTPPRETELSADMVAAAMASGTFLETDDSSLAGEDEEEAAKQPAFEKDANDVAPPAGSTPADFENRALPPTPSVSAPQSLRERGSSSSMHTAKAAAGLVSSGGGNTVVGNRNRSNSAISAATMTTVTPVRAATVREIDTPVGRKASVRMAAKSSKPDLNANSNSEAADIVVPLPPPPPAPLEVPKPKDSNRKSMHEMP